jgi:hypothetical protein
VGPGRAALLALALGAAAPAASPAPGAAPPTAASATADSGVAAGAGLLPARVTVTPGRAALGQPLELSAWVLVPRGVRAQWLPPDSGGAFTWGARAARRAPGPNGLDTLALETRLQVFSTGPVGIPGPRLALAGASQPLERRLPAVRVTIEPSPGVADSNAELRAPRAPLAAPWWERVPWTMVAIAAAVIAALVVWLRLRRRRVAAPAVAGRAAAPARDPAETLLAELQALRGLNLPGLGRYAEHALRLTRIARRFLEATTGTPRPGDSTPELVIHLEAAHLEPAQLERLGAALRLWDQLKFARRPSTVEEARRAEQLVEEMARRRIAERERERAAVGGGERVA